MGQITRYIFSIARPFSQSFQVPNMPHYTAKKSTAILSTCISDSVREVLWQPPASDDMCVAWHTTKTYQLQRVLSWDRDERSTPSIAACRVTMVTGSLLSLLIPRTDRFFRRKDRSRVRLRLFSRNDEGYKLDSSQAEVDLSGCKEHGHKHDTGSSLDYSDAKNVLGKTTLNCQQHDAAPGLQVNAFSESFWSFQEFGATVKSSLCHVDRRPDQPRTRWPLP